MTVIVATSLDGEKVLLHMPTICDPWAAYVTDLAGAPIADVTPADVTLRKKIGINDTEYVGPEPECAVYICRETLFDCPPAADPVWLDEHKQILDPQPTEVEIMSFKIIGSDQVNAPVCVPVEFDVPLLQEGELAMTGQTVIDAVVAANPGLAVVIRDDKVAVPLAAAITAGDVKWDELRIEMKACGEATPTGAIVSDDNLYLGADATGVAAPGGILDDEGVSLTRPYFFAAGSCGVVTVCASICMTKQEIAALADV